jgi:hypothetical protein
MPGFKEFNPSDSGASELRSVSMPPRRPSPVIEAQIADFLATLPQNLAEPPPDDFAARIQLESWKNHLRELKTELDQAIDSEIANSNLLFNFSGAPVADYEIAAAFLGNFLSKAQNLLFALAQAMERKSTEMRRPRTTLVEDYRLFVSATFASALGVKFKSYVEGRVEVGRWLRTTDLLEEFCSLLDPQLTSGDLLSPLSSYRVRERYLDLLGFMAREDAIVTVRTKSRRQGVRLNASQSRDLATWVESLTESTSTPPLVHVLAGGSIATEP